MNFDLVVKIICPGSILGVIGIISIYSMALLYLQDKEIKKWQNIFTETGESIRQQFKER